MKLKMVVIFTILSLLLAGCGGGEAAAVDTGEAAVEQSDISVEQEEGAASVEEPAEEDKSAGQGRQAAGNGTQLVMLTFSLEQTELAVTPAQAEELLPLWKGVKALSESDIAAAEELEALYAQISEAMTDEQLAQIGEANEDPTAMRELMTELGVTAQGGGSGDGSEEMQRPEGMGPGGGGGEGFGGREGGGEFEGEIDPEMQATMQAQRGGGAGGNMMNFLLEPLIELLEQRAAE